MTVTPQQFGAIGDGDSHPLSGVYSSLADAQAVYPFAVSLDDELDWCGMQQAIDTARCLWGNQTPGWALGMRICVPPGQYRINRTVQIRSVRSLVLEGDGLPLLLWYGDDASPMFRFTNANHCELRRLWLMHGVAQPNVVLSAIDLERGSAGTWTPTACLFEEVRIGGFNLGTFQYGVRILVGEGGSGNNDYHQFRGCSFDSYSEAGALIAASQAHMIAFEHCGFIGANVGKCAIRCTALPTQLTVLCCGGGQNMEMDFDFRQGIPFNTVIDRWNAEHSVRLCQIGVGANSNPFNLAICNSRWESSNVAADGLIVKGWGPGPLRFEYNKIASWNSVAPKICWDSSWPGATKSAVFARGNSFTRGAAEPVYPFDCHDCVLLDQGNTYWSDAARKWVAV